MIWLDICYLEYQFYSLSLKTKHFLFCFVGAGPSSARYSMWAQHSIMLIYLAVILNAMLFTVLLLMCSTSSSIVLTRSACIVNAILMACSLLYVQIGELVDATYQAMREYVLRAGEGGGDERFFLLPNDCFILSIVILY